jgi:hypothetical protein
MLIDTRVSHIGHEQSLGHAGCPGLCTDAEPTGGGDSRNLVAGLREGHGCGVLPDGSGEAAEGSSPGRGAEMAFQPGDGGQANPCLISQPLLGQAALGT